MSMMRNAWIPFVAALLFAPILGAQGLSRYRNYSLGTSLAAVLVQVGQTSEQIATIHQSPALIQELTWWPIESSEPSAPPESVQQVRFSFCNGLLYRITVTYDEAATKGLTPQDVVQDISAKYGIATRQSASTNPPAIFSLGTAELSVAVWEDSQNLATLYQSPLFNSFRLVVLSKHLEAQADAAIAEGVKQELDDAPQREIARVKKLADDLEAKRLANLKAFRY